MAALPCDPSPNSRRYNEQRRKTEQAAIPACAAFEAPELMRHLCCKGDDSKADAERAAILRTLRMSSGGTGLMHESYWFEDSSVYTRFWFAMASTSAMEFLVKHQYQIVHICTDSYMGEVLLHLAETRPHLLFKDL